MLAMAAFGTSNDQRSHCVAKTCLLRDVTLLTTFCADDFDCPTWFARHFIFLPRPRHPDSGAALLHAIMNRRRADYVIRLPDGRLIRKHTPSPTMNPRRPTGIKFPPRDEPS